MYLILFCSSEVVFSFFPGGQELWFMEGPFFLGARQSGRAGTHPQAEYTENAVFSVAVCILKFAGAYPGVFVIPYPHGPRARTKNQLLFGLYFV